VSEERPGDSRGGLLACSVLRCGVFLVDMGEFRP
jgi:hypothetical protein